jgi:hypothetical protein
MRPRKLSEWGMTGKTQKHSNLGNSGGKEGTITFNDSMFARGTSSAFGRPYAESDQIMHILNKLSPNGFYRMSDI